MTNTLSLDERTLAGVANAEQGEVGTDTRFHFEQERNRIRATYSGGEIVDGYLLGPVEGCRWDIRYVELNEAGETATGQSIGVVSLLDDGRVRVNDEWERESKEGAGTSVLKKIE